MNNKNNNQDFIIENLFNSQTATKNFISNEELIFSLAKIFNIEQQKILDNIGLFSNINPYVKNIIYYMAQIQNQQKLISASYAMEFLLNYYPESYDAEKK